MIKKKTYLLIYKYISRINFNENCEYHNKLRSS